MHRHTLTRALVSSLILACVSFCIQFSFFYPLPAQDRLLEVEGGTTGPPPNEKRKQIDRVHRNETSASIALCSTPQIVEGKWVQSWLPSVPYVSIYRHLRCFPDEHYTQSPYPTWSWKPFASIQKECSWNNWDPKEFLRLTARATVSIIGDSLSWEQYASLLQLLGEKNVKQKHQHWSKSHNENYARSVGTTRFIFRNDKHLQFLEDSFTNNFPIVLVLNRGAHYVNDTALEESMKQTIQDLKKWRQQCENMGMTCHLVWRTTVPGHPNCRNDTQPKNDLTIMEDLIRNPENYDNLTITYHWQDFRRQNELLVKWLHDSGLEFTLLDAYRVNLLRPDEHRTVTNDCLHNCYPGKMDLYNQWLLHILRKERSEKDTKYLEDMYQQYVKSQ